MIDSDPLGVSFTAGIAIECEPLMEEKDAEEFKERDTTGLRETDIIRFKRKDAEGLKENPEVCCDPLLFQHNAVLTHIGKGEGGK